jgi:protein-histidine N-methyltransferase
MTDSDPDSDDNNNNDGEEEMGGEVTAQGRRRRSGGAAAHRRSRPGHLKTTPALLSAFTASLDAHKVRLRFFAGGWASLRELLPLSLSPQAQGTSSPSASPSPSPAAPPQPQPQSPPSYDVVLASETIYRTETFGVFLNVLRTAVGASPAPVADTQVAAAVPSPLCLVAAKVLYFGVGGGVQAFMRAVEGENGSVRTVWEHREGVGRMIMRVEW